MQPHRRGVPHLWRRSRTRKLGIAFFCAQFLDEEIRLVGEIVMQ